MDPNNPNPTPPADPNPNPPAGDPNNPPAPPAPAPGTPDFNKIAAEKRILEKKLAEFEKAEEERKKAAMTELERLQLEAKEAKDRAAKLERENLISKSASKLGLPSDLWSRVQGSTAEEIEADITSLLGFIKPATPNPNPANTGNPPAPPPPNNNAAEKERLEKALEDATRRHSVAEMLTIKGKLASLNKS